MEKIHHELTEIKNRIASKGLRPAELFDKTQRAEILDEKIQRLEEKYLEACLIEEINSKNPAIAPKRMLLEKVDYIFVTFKSTDTANLALKHF